MSLRSPDLEGGSSGRGSAKPQGGSELASPAWSWSGSTRKATDAEASDQGLDKGRSVHVAYWETCDGHFPHHPEYGKFVLYVY